MKKLAKSSISFLAVIAILVSSFGLFSFAADEFNISTMHTGTDNNCFRNDASNFVFGGEKSKYYVNAADFNKLSQGESEDIKQLIASQVLSEFHGSGYGIAATMALSYVGMVDLPAENYYSVNLKDFPAFRNTVNFYQLTQFCENKEPEKTVVMENNRIKEDSLRQIVEYAKGGDPFIISFRTQSSYNTFVACGIENESSLHKIRLIDISKHDDFVYMIIPSSCVSFSFENSDCKAGDIIEMDFSTLSAFSQFASNDGENIIYSAVSGSAFNDILCTSFSSDFTLTNAEGKTLNFKNGEITGDITVAEVKYIACSEKPFGAKAVIKIDDSDSYTVHSNAPEIDLTVVGDEGLFFTVQGKNIYEITAQSGTVTVEGENMDYSVNALSTDKAISMMNFSGTEPSKVVIETLNGTTLTGNGENAHAAFLAGGGIYEKDFKIENNTLSVVYTDIVKNDMVTDSGNSTAKTLIIIAVVLVFLIALVLAYKKYIKKNAEQKGRVNK